MIPKNDPILGTVQAQTVEDVFAALAEAIAAVVFAEAIGWRHGRPVQGTENNISSSVLQDDAASQGRGE